MLFARFAPKKEERWGVFSVANPKKKPPIPFSPKKEGGCFFFGKNPKKRTTFPLFCERSEHYLNSYEKLLILSTI
jgi:hypothetical protein